MSSNSRKLDEILTYVQTKVAESKSAPRKDFKDIIRPNWRSRTDILRSPGVYIIYKEDRPIYVGMAGKGKHSLNYRLGDLFFYSPNSKNHFHHTLTEKLLDRRKHFRTISKLREFYFSCRVRTLETRTFQQARTLEAVMIELLEPEYND